MTSPQDHIDDLFAPLQAKPLPQLNPQQQLAHDTAVAYVTGQPHNGVKVPDCSIVMIKGYAGTGKTFTTVQIIETAKKFLDKSSSYRTAVVATAPTHKAVRVMRKNADLGSKVQYRTIHSLLAIKAETDYKTGKKVFVKSRDPEDGDLEDVAVILLDEVSMVGEELWGYVMDAVEGGVKLIILGDSVQIPPVDEKDSPVFLDATKYGIKVLELTQSMRQAGDNPILDYATEIRNTYKSKTLDPTAFGKVKVEDDLQGIIVEPGTNVRLIDGILEDHFGSPNFKADADYMKVVCWTNKTVDQFNKKIRRMLFPVPEGALALPMIVNGEKLILDERYILPGTAGITLPTNEELEVVDYKIMRRGFRWQTWSPLGYSQKEVNPQIYRATVRYKNYRGQEQKVDIDIIHESSAAEYATILKAIQESAKATAFGTSERTDMWRHFYAIKELFAVVKYNYAVTAHKSQGSTYENCMLVYWDIKNNPKLEERNRIIYVAATRAKKKLFIIT